MWLKDPSADSKFFPPDKNVTLLIPSLVQDLKVPKVCQPFL